MTDSGYQTPHPSTASRNGLVARANEQPSLARWGGGVAIASGALAFVTITAPWVDIIAGSLSLGDLADPAVGFTSRGTAVAAVVLYLLGGVIGLASGVVGVAAVKRTVLTAATVGVFVSGLLSGSATVTGWSMIDRLTPDHAMNGPLLGGFVTLATLAAGALLLVGRGVAAPRT
ncbi:hypothetical protein [Nocardia sp. AG03]|uniref:hypothetical protein n=1 Tax=Nocardia sp. AG03 TaxID=3025312 RepID=UPI0024183C1C|nr:hypothetical protein [Nocardia sp. AG03]